MGRNNAINKDKQKKQLDNHMKKIQKTKQTSIAKKASILEQYKQSLKSQ
jgi:hypothetical protein